ncbi:MAG TPA: FliH/SctL family protein [Phycisphaerales bacterium]|nr:FliH/SctL family protein [Phycisphaerales bacterium]
MALIKGATTDRLVKDAMVLDLADLGLQAERMMVQAKQTANELVAKAQAEANRLVSSADGRGYAEGFQRGEAAGRIAGEQAAREEVKKAFSERLEELSEKWLAALERWEGERRDMYLEAKEDVARFAVEVARKVVRRKVESDSMIVQDQVAGALSALNRPTALTIRVNPDERKVIEEVMPKLKAGLETCEHIRLVDDERVGKGGCIVQTTGGAVDARIETQMDRIAEAIVTGTLNTESGEAQKDSP